MAMSPSNAPGFVGPTPPDRVQMTAEEHLNAALQQFAAGGLDPTEVRAFKRFVIAFDALVKQQVGQQPGGGQQPGAQQGEDVPPIGNDTEDAYGNQNETPTTQDYGA